MSAADVVRSSGKFDPQARRRSQRSGRETGCWVYIAGEQLGRGGFLQGEPRPWYRISGGERGRYVVTLFRDP